MRRVVVVGCPGAGKTTLAVELAQSLGLTHIELDALQHREGWTQASDAEFRNALVAAMDSADRDTDGWTMCGNYNTKADDIRLARADTVVWLDLPRGTVMRQVIRRTVSRAVLGRELWNGNREPLTNFYRWDPEKNVMRWAWVHHPRYRALYEAHSSDGTWSHLEAIHLRSRADIEQFLTTAIQAATFEPKCALSASFGSNVGDRRRRRRRR